MFNEFLSALIYEILAFLSKHPDFFELGEKTREEKLEHLRIPAQFKVYLVLVSGAHFLKDLKLILQVTNGENMEGLPLSGSPFFKSVLHFFVESFASKLDEVEAKDYLLSYEKRLEKAQNLFESKSRMAYALRDLIVGNSYQELSQAISNLSQYIAGADFVLVQAPREVESELKKEIRKGLSGEHPSCFPVFQINRQLIGGLRLFVNGKAQDKSWFSHIQKLTSLSS